MGATPNVLIVKYLKGLSCDFEGSKYRLEFNIKEYFDRRNMGGRGVWLNLSNNIYENINAIHMDIIQLVFQKTV